MNIIEKENMSLMQREDGYVNATALCKSAGKLVGNYLRNEQTKSFLDELSGSMQIRIDHLVKPVLTNVPNAEKGTYVHPKVAIHLAQWLSPQFAVFVTEVIFDFMNGNTPTQAIEENEFAKYITQERQRVTVYPREWVDIVTRLYGTHITPNHVINYIYNVTIGNGATAYIRSFREDKRHPLYMFLTDDGVEKIWTFLRKVAREGKDCKTIREFENILYDYPMLENKEE